MKHLTLLLLSTFCALPLYCSEKDPVTTRYENYKQKLQENEKVQKDLELKMKEEEKSLLDQKLGQAEVNYILNDTYSKKQDQLKQEIKSLKNKISQIGKQLMEQARIAAGGKPLSTQTTDWVYVPVTTITPEVNIPRTDNETPEQTLKRLINWYAPSTNRCRPPIRDSKTATLSEGRTVDTIQAMLACMISGYKPVFLGSGLDYHLLQTEPELERLRKQSNINFIFYKGKGWPGYQVDLGLLNIFQEDNKNSAYLVLKYTLVDMKKNENSYLHGFLLGYPEQDILAFYKKNNQTPRFEKDKKRAEDWIKATQPTIEDWIENLRNDPRFEFSKTENSKEKIKKASDNKPEENQLYVQQLNGPLHIISSESLSTIGDLKQKLSHITGAPKEQLALISEAQTLQNNRLLSTIDTNDLFPIQLIIRAPAASKYDLPKIRQDLLKKYQPRKEICGGVGKVKKVITAGAPGALACMIAGFKPVAAMFMDIKKELGPELIALAHAHNITILAGNTGVMFTPEGRRNGLLLYKFMGMQKSLTDAEKKQNVKFVYKTGEPLVNFIEYLSGYLLGYDAADLLADESASSKEAALKQTEQWIQENSKDIEQWARANIPDLP